MKESDRITTKLALAALKRIKANHPAKDKLTEAEKIELKEIHSLMEKIRDKNE